MTVDRNEKRRRLAERFRAVPPAPETRSGSVWLERPIDGTQWHVDVGTAEWQRLVDAGAYEVPPPDEEAA